MAGEALAHEVVVVVGPDAPALETGHEAGVGHHVLVALRAEQPRDVGEGGVGEVEPWPLGGHDAIDLDGVALDVHAQDVLGVLTTGRGVVGQLDAAGLAAATDLHLGLHHDRVADAVGGGHGVVHRGDRLTGRDGDVVGSEELLPLVLVQVH